MSDTGEMTEQRADTLRVEVRNHLHEELRRYGVPREIMLLAEHPHSYVVTDVFHIPDFLPRSALAVDRPAEQWDLIAQYLDRWGWC